jgi:uncharacterized membrane protein YhaH (DUF805 family)
LIKFFNIKNKLSRSAFIGYLFAFELLLISFRALIPSNFYLNNIEIVNLLYRIVEIFGVVCIVTQRLNALNKPMTHILFILIPFYNLYFVWSLFFSRGKDQH